ncbi:MAG: ABC transporter ATP-binding protein [Acidimicrobiales bacterium]
MADVALEKLTKRYPNGFQAVSDLDLDIRDGEFLVLVGPSGCGKSTALRMIAGLEDITEGELRIQGKRMNEVQPKDRDIAMVFQNYALYPHMSVYDNVAFALKLSKTPKDEIDQRVQEAAKILELEPLLDNKPGQLSGGQRQRVAMGRAIVRKPKAFLMDEPLSNLDAKLRVQMRAEIARIQRDLGVTTFYVTHDQVEAMTMGDRVAVIKDGHLQQVDTPQNLYDDPDNIFVGAFIGSPSMNLFESAMGAIDDEGATLSLGSQQLRVPKRVLDNKPALQAFGGKPVTLGMRPEDLEDATIATDAVPSARFKADVELVEALGSELMVHASIDATLASSGDPDAVEAEESRATGGGSMVVGRFSPRSQVSRGETIDVAVDVDRLYFFDPDSGNAIRS